MGASPEKFIDILFKNGDINHEEAIRRLLLIQKKYIKQIEDIESIIKDIEKPEHEIIDQFPNLDEYLSRIK